LLWQVVVVGVAQPPAPSHTAAAVSIALAHLAGVQTVDAPG
jgi:hypothetical protein